MASRIQIRRGIKAKMPNAVVGEPLYTIDTHEFFIGTGSGNVNMGGSQWYTGTAMSGTGGGNSYSSCPMVKVGDKYLNTLNGYIYECITAGSGSNAKWTYKGSLRGPAGAQGPTGPAGSNGTNGTNGANGTSVVWHTGTAISGGGTQSYSISDAHAGDFYFNTSTGDIYKASSSASWVWQCNIKGPTGPTGPAGPAGPQGPVGTTAEKLTTAQTIDGVKFDGSEAITHYGECSTDGSTRLKRVNIPGFKLETGAKAYIKFTNANTSLSPQLNISSTGDKNIYYNGKGIESSWLVADKIYEFIYDGTNYEVIGPINYANCQGGALAIGGRSNKFTQGDYFLDDAVCLGGQGNEIKAGTSCALAGDYNIVDHCQVYTGHYAVAKEGGDVYGTRGTAFCIGNGELDSRSNAFRVDYNGNVYGTGQFNSTGADYAEFFEWLDGNSANEDRRGLFVTLDGDKIRAANSGDDYILGVISGTPGVVGNNRADTWQGMWLTDIFGEVITRVVHHDAEYDGDKLIREACDAVEPIVNPDYNPDEKYIPREDRPEWGIVGMMGQLVVIDDGTCVVNGYCKVADGGTATASDKGYRVIARLDETHIKVMFR